MPNGALRDLVEQYDITGQDIAGFLYERSQARTARQERLTPTIQNLMATREEREAAAAEEATRFEVPALVRPETAIPAQQFGVREREELAPMELPEAPLLEQLGGVAEEMLAGEIPEDVQAQVEQIAAERGIAGGVLGQAGEFLTARDLGMTSIQVQQLGADLAKEVISLETQRELAMIDVNNRRQQFNEEMNLQFAALNEQTREWEDRFQAMMTEVDVSADQMRLATLELVSINERYMQGLVNDLIIQNSKDEIAGVQESVNQLARYFNVSNRTIMRMMGLI